MPEEDFRLLVSSIRDYAIFMLDPTGHVMTWNAGAERIKGYAAHEIIGRHFSTFYPQADVAAGKPDMELQVAAEVGRYEDEGWRIRKDGSRFWANVVITALRDQDGVLRGFGKVTRDLTARRAAELKYRVLVESVRDYAIFLLDPNGVVQTWNAGAEAIKGYKADEIIGKSFEVFYPREEVARGVTKMELETAAREGRWEGFGWRLRKDGSCFWANVVITALHDDEGNLTGFAKVTRDLTDRKRAEDALRKAYEEQEAFSYSVSHDLRAPLRSMSGFSEALVSSYGDKLDERGRDYLRRIRDSAQRMASLIDALLQLSRLSRTPLDLVDVDLTTMAEGIVAELRKSEPARDVEVTLQPGLHARADATLLRVVLDNLLSNAWKFTSSRPTAHIELGATIERGVRTFFVRDDGAGFDMAYAGKLFGAFHRLHRADEFPGTGIGLATIKRIVHRHEGDVWATGEVGRGATFYFTLGGSR